MIVGSADCPETPAKVTLRRLGEDQGGGCFLGGTRRPEAGFSG